MIVFFIISERPSLNFASVFLEAYLCGRGAGGLW